MNKKISKDILIQLYQNKLSMMEISKKLNCSLNKISYWMHKYKIPRRKISNALYIKNNPLGNPYKIKKIKLDNYSFLLGLGLGIYWGEGNKADKYSIRVGTSDPNMILTFRHFLITICSVKNEKFHYSLMCFKDTNPNTAAEFWAKKLKIKKIQLGKITQIASMGKGTYKKISKNGVCTIYVYNIKLKKWLMAELEKINYNVEH